VACVGSGPASLTVAGDLVQKGHDVTVGAGRKAVRSIDEYLRTGAW
jgi:NADPH-dependent glutamate synthase beta subunit-like oxidoreductase